MPGSTGFQEFVAPITVDLRAPDERFDIVKGIENVSQHVKDFPLDPSLTTTDIEEGDWLVLGPLGTLIAPTSTALANTYPLWVGNDQFDAQATGGCTVIMGCGFNYRTNKFDPGVTYTAGMNLTVKVTSGNARWPTQATGSDPILARVVTVPDSKGVMEILVLVR